MYAGLNRLSTDPIFDHHLIAATFSRRQATREEIEVKNAECGPAVYGFHSFNRSTNAVTLSRFFSKNPKNTRMNTPSPMPKAHHGQT